MSVPLRSPYSVVCNSLLALSTLVLAAPARGETCRANVSVGGKKATLANCAVAVYDNAGVTLWLTEQPVTGEELSTFQLNSYPQDKDPSGKARTMMHLGFCPGGGAAKADPKAVRSVELSLSHSSSLMLQRQWVANLPGDTYVKFERLSGELKPGGSFAGRVTGKAPDDASYSWEVDFDLVLPEKSAAAGPGCGS
jgi:hypothetical protein